ncbi:MAG: type II secretion system F family protein [Clostridia bacterium]|nr:type II secretion system F family protein [Clostridia bacterium]
MPIYYKCNMTLIEHIIAYIVCTIICTALLYVFYHLLLVSLILGAALAIYLERIYAASTVRKRQRNLRLQFRMFLESMSVACRSGSTEVQALNSALEDLKISYREDSDIVREISNIIRLYNYGNVKLRVLFNDFAERSDLEDVRSFAAIYEVIEGKSDRIGDILTETSDIIGEKIEIEQEIETVISSAKSETNMMLILPVIIVVAMSAMGGELMSALFTTSTGHLAATASLALFAVSYIMATKVSNINV